MTPQRVAPGTWTKSLDNSSLLIRAEEILLFTVGLLVCTEKGEFLVRRTSSIDTIAISQVLIPITSLS